MRSGRSRAAWACHKAVVETRRERRSVLEVVAVGLRDDLPAVGELHGDEVVGEVARRQLATHLDEGRVVVGAVDGDDEVLARLAFGLRDVRLRTRASQSGTVRTFSSPFSTQRRSALG